ncbi:dihydrofolate reductase family protein [Hamadaea tsunoensis]|uniref:dihydrofolate reductase family protein n=1 Tax=Hamadaea tsunoensis TaxID=53368 RepID=UPI000418275C|nr:dihydrofolate reductase family protein [Hamadaea tsunoensis]
MAKMLYSVTMSLDGYITGPGGDMSWAVPYLKPNPLVDELIANIGSLLVGGRTLGGDDPHRGTEREGKAFGGGWSGPQFVLTRDTSRTSTADLTFVHDPETAIRMAKEAAGDKYVNVIGAETARLCLAAGQLDEVLTIVAPVLLGGGVRLFDRPAGDPVPLERMSLSSTDVVVNIWARVVK